MAENLPEVLEINRFIYFIIETADDELDDEMSPLPSRLGRPKNADLFDDELKKKFLQRFSRDGVQVRSALAIGISPGTVIRHRKEDPEFAEAFEFCKEAFRDRVNLQVNKLALDGLDEPVYYMGDVVGHKKVYSERMLAMLAKKVDPGYRDQVDVNATVKAAVMVIPAPINSEDAFIQEAQRIADENNAST